jgi:hypothetical protein
MGFTLPFEKWLQRNLRAEVDKVLGDEDRLSQAGLLPGGVRQRAFGSTRVGRGGAEQQARARVERHDDSEGCGHE